MHWFWRAVIAVGVGSLVAFGGFVVSQTVGVIGAVAVRIDIVGIIKIRVRWIHALLRHTVIFCVEYTVLVDIRRFRRRMFP